MALNSCVGRVFAKVALRNRRVGVHCMRGERLQEGAMRLCDGPGDEPAVTGAEEATFVARDLGG